MTRKTLARDASGNIIKTPGWFSWRHETRDAHEAANEGRKRVEARARRRLEAEERNARTPHERRAIHRRGDCDCALAL